MQTIISILVIIQIVGCSTFTKADAQNTNEMASNNAVRVDKIDNTTEKSNEKSANLEETQTLSPKRIDSMRLDKPSGDIIKPIAIEKPSEISKDEALQMDRAMRAYVPSGDSLVINNSNHFFFYENMNENEQSIYDAIMMLAEDPTDTNNIIVHTTDSDVQAEDFNKELSVAYWGVIYDHPELFWLYYALETDIKIQCLPNENGNYDCYFFLKEPYHNYEKEMNAFNEAVEAFLEDINIQQDDYLVAKDIHDKLIDMVSYDTEVAEKQTIDLAHTAYGALVENSRGKKNTAVCDGYAQAYLYLLQQAGIEATVVLGIGGSTYTTAGGHAWNIVKLGNDWYEVDSTWDDFGGWDEEIEKADLDDQSKNVYLEALNDNEYREKVEHYMYNITTSDIRDFRSSSVYDYYTKDGLYVINLVFDSVHLRSTDIDDETVDKLLMEMIPEAEGLEY